MAETISGIALGIQHLAPTSATKLTLPTAYPTTGGIGPDGTTTFHGVKRAFVSISTATVYYRDDGTAPTAGAGIPLPVGTVLIYEGNLGAIQFISATGVVDVAYYG